MIFHISQLLSRPPAVTHPYTAVYEPEKAAASSAADLPQPYVAVYKPEKAAVT